MRYHTQYNIKSHIVKYICVYHYSHPKYTRFTECKTLRLNYLDTY